MEVILNYNFEPASIADKRFDLLYQNRRRDSIFAYVFKEGDCYYALRDHLGITPLYYLQHHGKYFFATSLGELPHRTQLEPAGLKTYLGFGTTKISPLFKGIKIVPPGSVVKISGNQENIIYRHIINPHEAPLTTSLPALVEVYESLFSQAIERQVGKKTPSLYLSGGIDSTLIGVYLKKLGIPFNTFSSATREKDAEYYLMKKGVEILTPNKFYLDQLSQDYYQLAKSIPILYKQPQGIITALAVASLWRNTPLADQPMIFIGQNCDVITNAMDNQFLPTFGTMLPRGFRHLISWHPNRAVRCYAKTMTDGLVDFSPINFGMMVNYNALTNFQLVSLAGIYLGRTPADSECLIQPAINRRITVGNPYYDMDVVEFLMGLRLRHKISFFKKTGRQIISADKLIIRALAQKNKLPPEMIYRKKGFTISKKGSVQRIEYFEKLPNKIDHLYCRNTEQSFALSILTEYLKGR
jgi:hypothetical protein